MNQEKQQIALEITDWFDPQINPARPGVYQRKLPEGDGDMIVYSLWTGEEWGRNAITPDEAAKTEGPSLIQGRPWRGLLGKVVGVASLQGANDELIYAAPYEVAE